MKLTSVFDRFTLSCLETDPGGRGRGVMWGGDMCQGTGTNHGCSVAEGSNTVTPLNVLLGRRCSFYLFCNCPYLFSLLFKVAL